MSPTKERGFAPVLREVESGMALPLPDRIRILRELEYDLEELWGRFVAEGVPDDEARRRALDALVPDAGSLVELDHLHAPLYRRLTQRFPSSQLRLAERTALGVAVAAVLGVQTATLLRVDLLRDPSPFLWPVLVAGGFLFALVLAKGFQLWIKGDHTQPTRGLGSILVAAGIVLSLGIGGTIFDLFRLAVVLEQTPELAEALVPLWLFRSSALLSVAILLALAGGLAWFILSQWVALVRRAHREVLGLNRPARPKGD